jgi:rfaE bifunctional protein nucleotidyltransferase chain/domain/rfaE bifunctional protein kinase chain/domain
MARPIVVVGDCMLDIDIDGSATRLSPEAPVPVVDAERVWHRPGGAGLAAVLAARTDSDVILVTAIADDAEGHELTELLESAGVTVARLRLSGTTACKTRIRATGQSVLRLDHGDGTVPAGTVPAAVVEALDDAAAVCVADYGRGVTAHPALRTLIESAAQRVPVVWDPHPRGADPVAGCRLVTPNQGEAQSCSADALRQKWQAHGVCVTLGSDGAVLSTDTGDTTHVPVPPSARAGTGRTDACGAGDRFAVAATRALADGADIVTAVQAAVTAASRFVATGGAVAVSTPVAVGTPGRGTDGPAMITTDATQVRDHLRARPGKLVATGGCFDLLHTGHVRLLHQAGQLGDSLVVLLNSDASVRRLKGPGRPVTTALDRARVLAALACVDAVLIFDESSPESQLETLRPDVWVKGGDYTEADLPEAAVVRGNGGEVVLLPTVTGYSSSKLIRDAAMTERGNS